MVPEIMGGFFGSVVERERGEVHEARFGNVIAFAREDVPSDLLQLVPREIFGAPEPLEKREIGGSDDLDVAQGFFDGKPERATQDVDRLAEASLSGVTVEERWVHDSVPDLIQPRGKRLLAYDR
jgi:hypothetical protein